ncbi:MAG: family 43 glycosylhydrolase [Bacillota bacterium]|nr:family 43 glycosylhydrolase [Bacillota bacterium]
MRKKFLIMFAIMLIMVFDIATSFADNPIVQTVYTADPAPMVYNGRVYAYVGHDEDDAPTTTYKMKEWRCYSSADMVNWTDHGAVLPVTAFKWATQTKDANAAQVIYRNGKFYYYVSVYDTTHPGIAVGVAVSNSPTGPFTDAIGHALVTNDMTKYASHGWDDLDPTVFIDDDGQAYLYWGNNACYYAKLNNDMISINGSINAIPLNTTAFGPDYEEAPWVYKRDGTYYMIYASGFPECIRYSTSSSPTGPWTYKGVVMTTQGGSNTNHPGIIDFNSNSYFFYHTDGLSGSTSYKRSVCIEQFKYNTNGTIPQLNMTKTGVTQISNLNPYVKTEAETICMESGVETEQCSEGGVDVCNIENGDYIKVKGVNFASGAASFDARVASATSGGNIELRLDSPTGTLVGTCAVTGTGGWQTWVNKSCNVSGATGIHDLYLKFTGGSGNLFNFNWWKFNTSLSSPTSTPTSTPTLKPTSTPTSKPSSTSTSTPTPTSTPANSIDLNHDGAINMADVILLASKFNTVKGNTGYIDSYDLNKDGVINMADVIIIAAKFNTIV